jgi:PPOX class probable F420-dependent enzyme
VKISTTIPAGNRGAFSIGAREHAATLNDLPAGARALLDNPVTATMACHNGNGTIHISPMWIDIDGDHILLNSARGRTKDRNLRARPNLSLLLVDPKDPYRWMSIQGKVVQIIDEDDAQHGRTVTHSIDKMSTKYLREPSYPLRDHDVAEVRTLYRVEPVHVVLLDRTPQ